MAYIVFGEIKEEKIKVTFLGSETQVTQVLGSFENNGMRFSIVSLTDASLKESNLSPDSPVNALTGKQREVMTTAYNIGYYNLPRRISSQQLAEKLGLHKSAIASHRRKAEHRLLKRVFDK